MWKKAVLNLAPRTPTPLEQVEKILKRVHEEDISIDVVLKLTRDLRRQLEIQYLYYLRCNDLEDYSPFGFQSAFSLLNLIEDELLKQLNEY
jgi:uncharacterized protein YfeS